MNLFVANSKLGLTFCLFKREFLARKRSIANFAGASIFDPICPPPLSTTQFSYINPIAYAVVFETLTHGDLPQGKTIPSWTAPKELFVDVFRTEVLSVLGAQEPRMPLLRNNIAPKSPDLRLHEFTRSKPFNNFSIVRSATGISRQVQELTHKLWIDVVSIASHVVTYKNENPSMYCKSNFAHEREIARAV
jgi:hypothetical protein